MRCMQHDNQAWWTLHSGTLPAQALQPSLIDSTWVYDLGGKFFLLSSWHISNDNNTIMH